MADRSMYRPRSARVKKSESPSLSGWSSRPSSGHAKDGVFCYQSSSDALLRSSSGGGGGGSRGVTPRSANMIRSAPRPVSAVERSFKMRKQPPDFDELRQRNIRRSERDKDCHSVRDYPPHTAKTSIATSPSEAKVLLFGMVASTETEIARSISNLTRTPQLMCRASEQMATLFWAISITCMGWEFLSNLDESCQMDRQNDPIISTP